MQMTQTRANRRTLLAGAAASLAGAVLPRAAGAESRERQDRSRGATFVLVPGSWYNALTWERVAHLLVAGGHAVIARDRAAFGLNARFPQSYLQRPFDTAAFAAEPSPVASVTLQQDIDGVAAQILEAIEGGSRQVVLVGHSSGGLVITGVAEQYPQLIAHIVYLAAFMPAPGTTGLADLQSNSNGNLAAIGSLFLGNPQQTGALRVDWNSTDPAYFAGLQHGFYADGDAASFRAAIHTFAPDDPLSIYLIPTAKTAGRWGSVPRSFIRTGQDVAILPALQDRWIAQANQLTPGNPTTVYLIDASHSVLLSQPDKVASVLLEIARRS